jgi:hypothetical protein
VLEWNRDENGLVSGCVITVDKNGPHVDRCQNAVTELQVDRDRVDAGLRPNRLRTEAERPRLTGDRCRDWRADLVARSANRPVVTRWTWGGLSGSRLLLDKTVRTGLTSTTRQSSKGRGQAKMIFCLQHARVYQQGHVTTKGNAGLWLWALPPRLQHRRRV